MKLTAYLNQRFQLSYNVSRQAATYPNFASADFICHVRLYQGSTILSLDIIDITYHPETTLLIMRCASTDLINLVAGEYEIDFGFVLPGSDFELIDGGTITFNDGVTVSGVVGNPAPETGAGDTVMQDSDVSYMVDTTTLQSLTATVSALANAPLNRTLVAASMTIANPGVYVVTTAAITLTLPDPTTWPFSSSITIVDVTGSATPNIAIHGTINGDTGGATISAQHGSLTLVPVPTKSTWAAI